MILIPNVKVELQRRLFAGALEQLVAYGEPINQILEVDIQNGEVVYVMYDLPGPLCAREPRGPLFV